MLVPEKMWETTQNTRATAGRFPLIDGFLCLNKQGFSQSWQTGVIVPFLSPFVEAFCHH
jgi:hypothetical protein